MNFWKHIRNTLIPNKFTYTSTGIESVPICVVWPKTIQMGTFPKKLSNFFGDKFEQLAFTVEVIRLNAQNHKSFTYIV